MILRVLVVLVIKIMQSRSRIISQIRQCIFQFSIQFNEIFLTNSFIKRNSITFSTTKYIYLFGNNLNILSNCGIHTQSNGSQITETIKETSAHYYVIF